MVHVARRAAVLPELFAAVVAVALVEGGAAVHLLEGTPARAAVVATTFAVGAGIVLLPLVVAAIAATALARTRPMRRMQLGACLFLGQGGRGRRAMLAPAIVVHAFAFGEALVWGAIVFRRVAAGVRVELAAILAVGVTATALAVGAVVACAVLHAIAPAARWTQRRSPSFARLARGWLAPVLVAIAAVVTVRAMLPTDLSLKVCVVVAVVPLARIAPVHAWLARRLAGLSGVAFVASTLALGGFAYGRLGHLPGRAQLAVHHGPVVGALVLAAARHVADHDGDGYSPYLGGGDCDDRDPRVHPGAHDVPGNGRDEDCSGADATAYVDRPFAASGAGARPAGLVARPSVVVVHLDAVRPDHVGFTGYARPTTPNLDRFRAGATWFSRAYAPGPSTRASMTAILTGEDAARAAPARDDGTRLALRADVPTVDERLADRGYDRVGVTIPYVLESVRGIEKGFGVWESAWPADDDDQPEGRGAARTTDAVLARLARLGGDRPFFLYAHYLCAHQPYRVDPRFAFGSGLVDLYDGALATCDHEVGRLFAALDARPDRDRTAVIVLSDHGELLGEHGFVGHGTDLYEPAVRALLMLRVPGLDLAAVDAPVTLRDVAPTILALAGAARAQDGEGDGWNLLALAASPAASGHAATRPVFLQGDGRVIGVSYRSRAVVQGRFKYVRDVATGIEQLYDLDADPGEHTNLRRRLPDERARLAALLESWSAWITSD